MIYLTRMRLVNWNQYIDEQIEFDKSMTLVAAPNKSGKTVINDAFRYAIYGDTNFNVSKNVKDDRTLMGYVRGMISKENDDYYRPAEKYRTVTSHIVAEFYDDTNESWFILGAICEAVGKSDLRTSRYALEGKKLEDVQVRQKKDDGKSYVMTADEFQQAMHTELMYKKDTAMAKFMQMLGLNLKESGSLNDFRRRQRAILEYDPKLNTHDFIKKNVMPERENSALNDLREKREKIACIETELENTEKQAKMLDNILNKYDAYDKLGREIRENEICDHYFTLREKRIELQENNDTIENDQNLLSSLEERSVEAEKEASDLRDMEIQLHANLNDNDIGRMISSEENRLKDIENDIGRLTNDIEKNKKLHQNLKYMEQEFQDLTFEEIPDFNSGDVPESVKIDDLTRAEKAFASYRRNLYDQEKDIRKNISDLKDDLAELDRRIDEYRNYRPDDRMIADYIALKNAINERLISLGRKPSARMAYEDVSEITDESWRNVIEALLGWSRYTILVDPEDYDIADDVMIRSKHGRAHLFNTKRLMNKKTKTEPDSVVRYLDIQNKTAKKYFEYKIGRYSAVDESAVKNYDFAVAKTGKISSGLDNSYLQTKGITYCLGAEAFEKNMTNTQKEWDACDKKERKAEEDLKNIQELIQESDQYAKTFNVSDYSFSASASLKKKQEEKRKAERSLSELHEKMQEDEALAALHQRLDQTDEELTEKTEEAAKLKSEIRSLSDEIKDCSKKTEKLKEEAAECEKITKEDRDKDPVWTASVEKAVSEGKKKPWGESHASKRSQEKATARDNIDNAQTQYRITYDTNAPLNINRDSEDSYRRSKYIVEVHDIKKVKEELAREKSEQKKIFENTFVQSIRQNCEQVRRQINEISKELARHPFDGTSYRFKCEYRTDGIYGTILKYAEKTEHEAEHFNPQGGLFEYGLEINRTEEDEALLKEINEIIDKIAESGKMDDYADYRNYMDYDFIINSKNLHNVHLSRQSGLNSGSETQIPHYLILFSAMLMTYNEHANSLRLVILDEPFTLMDQGKIRQMLDLMKKMGFQILLFAPDPKEAFVSACGHAVTVILKGDHAEIVPMEDYGDIDEFQMDNRAGIVNLAFNQEADDGLQTDDPH